MKGPGMPKDYDGPWIVIKPSSKLWVGICESFVHAFITMRQLPEPELWFIARSLEHRLIIEGKGGWVHYAEPVPLRRNSNHLPYRGPLSVRDKEIREGRRLYEQAKRDSAKFGDLLG